MMPQTPVASPKADPMVPRLFTVKRKWAELPDTFSLQLTPEDGGIFVFEPGSFNMLYTFGVGEVPISISGDPLDVHSLTHTIREVATVTRAIGRLSEGDMLGVRGPFGTSWPIKAAKGDDMLFVAGGLGLAPIWPAILSVLANRLDYGNLVIDYGARTPESILYRERLRELPSRFDGNVQITVDRASGDWPGKVGVVTNLIKSNGFDAPHTTAFVCGPEVMMRFTAQALLEKGIPESKIYLSMERNMKCAIGFCGHCQFGPYFICRDGPVFRYDKIRDLLRVREL